MCFIVTQSCEFNSYTNYPIPDHYKMLRPDFTRIKFIILMYSVELRAVLSIYQHILLLIAMFNKTRIALWPLILLKVLLKKFLERSNRIIHRSIVTSIRIFQVISLI